MNGRLARDGSKLDVGFLAPANPTDRQAWSGTLFSMYEAIARTGVRVSDLAATLRPARAPWRRAFRELTSAAGYRLGNEGQNALSLARATGAKLSAGLRERPCDVVFAAVASHSLAFLETELPVVYMSDTTWKLVRTYYPENRDIPVDQADQIDELERRSIQRADLLVYPSQWAADSAVKDYGADPARIHLVPYGANIDVAPPRGTLTRRDPSAECRVLFIGNQWFRKGGDLAIETLVALAARGIKATLTVVSGNIPPELDLPSGVIPIGHIDKNDPEHRRRFEQILMESHFLLLPTRADCSPIVCCEAAAYGLPVVATATGGIPGLVEHGVNGYLVPEGSPGDAYAKAIAEGIQNVERYRRLAEATRDRYEERLNWNAWGTTVVRLLEQAVATPRRHAARPSPSRG